MLWIVLSSLLVFWLLGLVGGLSGSLIHVILAVAAIVLVIQLLSGRNLIT